MPTSNERKMLSSNEALKELTLIIIMLEVSSASAVDSFVGLRLVYPTPVYPLPILTTAQSVNTVNSNKNNYYYK